MLYVTLDISEIIFEVKTHEKIDIFGFVKKKLTYLGVTQVNILPKKSWLLLCFSTIYYF